MKYSDPILRDFLDGVLPEEKAQEIEMAMLQDAHLLAHIMSLDEMAEPVREALKTLPSQDRLDRLSKVLYIDAPVVEKRPIWDWRAIAASIAIGLTIGWAGHGLMTAQ